MSTKSVVLLVVCLICGYVVFTQFFQNRHKKSFDGMTIEIARCDLISDWLKKKSINETSLYGFSDTLANAIEKKGIKVNKSIMIKPETQIGDFFDQVKTNNVKCIVFNESLLIKDSIVEIQSFLKNGGVIYLRSYLPEIGENEELFQSILEAMKKGQACVVLNKLYDGNINSLSLKDRILAESIFVDDSNFIELENWHNNMIKFKAEYKDAPSPDFVPPK